MIIGKQYFDQVLINICTINVLICIYIYIKLGCSINEFEGVDNWNIQNNNVGRGTTL